MNEDDKIKDMANFFKQMTEDLNQETKKLFHTVVNGLVVSTIQLDLNTFETGIIDQKDLYTVERYKSLEEAEHNHLLWCERAKNMQYLISKSFHLNDEPDEHILKRFIKY
jgi:hypothetical protein